MFVVELDLGHLEAATPLGLVPQTILKRAARVLLGDEELYRFRVVKLGERVQTHRVGPYSAIRGEASVSRSRPRYFVLSGLFHFLYPRQASRVRGAYALQGFSA